MSSAKDLISQSNRKIGKLGFDEEAKMQSCEMNAKIASTDLEVAQRSRLNSNTNLLD